MATVDEFFSTIVQGERRQGIPDEQIARDLGISLERLRQLYPVSPTHRAPRPIPRPTPYVAPPTVEDDPVTRYQRPPDDGGGLVILLLLLLLES